MVMMPVTMRGGTGAGVFRRDANRFGFIHIEFGILVFIEAIVRRKQRRIRPPEHIFEAKLYMVRS